MTAGASPYRKNAAQGVLPAGQPCFFPLPSHLAAVPHVFSARQKHSLFFAEFPAGAPRLPGPRTDAGRTAHNIPARKEQAYLFLRNIMPFSQKTSALPGKGIPPPFSSSQERGTQKNREPCGMHAENRPSEGTRRPPCPEQAAHAEKPAALPAGCRGKRRPHISAKSRKA